jgi:hypothetical protein
MFCARSTAHRRLEIGGCDREQSGSHACQEAGRERQTGQPLRQVSSSPSRVAPIDRLQRFKCSYGACVRSLSSSTGPPIVK